ncbi:MAG: alpha/beta fold hydrolase [Candidatus Geothermincolia bacterium]
MPAVEWSHGDVSLENVRLHYVVQGEGPLVVLLHGFPEYWYSWRHQIPALARRFKVVAPDMRGYDLSDKPEKIEDYSMDHLTADVRRLIESFGETEAHVVGHDWGGAVAWSFAMAYPEHVDKLVVMNAPHPAAFAANIMSNPRQMMRSWYMFFFQIPRIPELALSAFDAFVLKRSFSNWAVDKSAFSPADLAALAEAAMKPGALTGGLNYYRAMFRNTKALASLRREAPLIKSPALLIWAEEDRALGKELTYGLERYFESDLTIRYIPNCSHWVQQEQPLLVNELMDEFL